MGELRKNFPVRPALEDVAIEFARLGFTSFGGPVAHIAFFREAFVVRRGWLSEGEFADLVALCQFLPGPASSQAAFALGMIRAGWGGAVIASVLFLWPSALCMIALAYFAGGSPDFATSAWVHGLKVATVGIVLHAVWSMSRALCPDLARSAIAVAVAAWCVLAPGSLANIAGIVLGLVIGRVLLARRPDVAGTGGVAGGGVAAAMDDSMLGDSLRVPVSRRFGAGLLVACGVVLAGSFVIGVVGRGGEHDAGRLNDNVEQAAAMYRSGSLVFGGGHVVLPLLRDQAVPRGWIGDEAFLTGYAGAQAVPGPLFSFAAYLGAAMRADGAVLPRWANGVVCVVAIFLPGWLLVAGAMPFWHRLCAMPGAVGALRGANAAVVGVLFAAWVDPVATTAIDQAWGPGLVDVAMAMGAFAALAWWRVPAWAVVLVCAAAMWAMSLVV